MKSHRAVQALQEIYKSKLGEKLKGLEGQFEATVYPQEHFLIRLDGVAFHTFLKGVTKPFDFRITNAMVRTTGDLITQFSAVTGYTSSDEISLVFTAIPTDSQKKRKQDRKEVIHLHQYGGRFQKLCSVAAGYASARFNYHLQQSEWEDGLKVKMMSGEAFFDGRVCKFQDPTELMECIYWRSNFDAFRNAISQVSTFHLKHKGTQGKSVVQLLEELQSKGIDVLTEFHPRFLFGTWVKRQRVLLEKLNPKTGEKVECFRTILRCGSFNWAEWTEEERIAFTTSKFWEEGHPPIDDVNSSLLGSK